MDLFIMKNLVDLIKNRTASRTFSSKKIEDESLEKILEAGRFAPSPLNSQPWHFTLVRNKESLKSLAQAAHHAHFIAQAQLVIIVSVNNNIDVDSWLIQHKQHLYSGAAAMQNMWLAAWSLDIGCCWVTLDEKSTRKIISLPEEQELIGALALGSLEESKTDNDKTNDRQGLCLMTSYEVFGQKKGCHEENCYTCLKLVPKSAAMSFEGEDYIKFFCGQDCYVEWQKRTRKWLKD